MERVKSAVVEFYELLSESVNYERGSWFIPLIIVPSAYQLSVSGIVNTNTYILHSDIDSK